MPHSTATASYSQHSSMYCEKDDAIIRWLLDHIDFIVSWEPEGRYYSKMFHWEPEGRYHCPKFMVTAPFWCSTEHLWIVIVPFWLSIVDIDWYIVKSGFTSQNMYNGQCIPSCRRRQCEIGRFCIGLSGSGYVGNDMTHAQCGGLKSP